MRLMSRLIGDSRGVAVAEYGLIAAVAGVAIAVGSLALGTAVSDELDNAQPPLELACTETDDC